MAARKKTVKRKVASRKRAKAKVARKAPTRRHSAEAAANISKAAARRWAQYRKSTDPKERRRLLGKGRTPRKVGVK